MTYDSVNDVYICSKGRKLKVTKIKNSKTKTGYEIEKTCYTCEDCSGCELKSKCIGGMYFAENSSQYK